jgi:C4-dicarboxylate-specific signal transduction histidine kinase
VEGRYITAIAIVLIVMIASVLRAKYRSERSRVGAQEDPETQRLRDEVKALKERLQVLERITVEKENSLEREIERLRDR